MTTEVENYPGFPEGIMGPELMQHFRAQAERFGTRFISDDATRIELSDGGIHRVWVGEEEHLAKSVILAMGAEPKRLGIPGELELAGRGVSTCGVCDGAFFKGEMVVVIGGGDSAMEDSIFVSKFASDLAIVHRRDDFRASKIMLDRARERDNISLKTPYVPEEFIAGDDGKIAKVRLRNAETGDVEEMEVGGAFVAIGHTPRSELVHDQVEVDDGGYVVTRDGSTRTNLAGVFAVGDLVDHTYRQAVTAAGTGCMGALDAEWYLETPHRRQRPTGRAAPVRLPKSPSRRLPLPASGGSGRDPAASSRRAWRAVARSGSCAGCSSCSPPEAGCRVGGGHEAVAAGLHPGDVEGLARQPVVVLIRPAHRDAQRRALVAAALRVVGPSGRAPQPREGRVAVHRAERDLRGLRHRPAVVAPQQGVPGEVEDVPVVGVRVVPIAAEGEVLRFRVGLALEDPVPAGVEKDALERRCDRCPGRRRRRSHGTWRSDRSRAGRVPCWPPGW